ncbi:MAG TPA: CPBP family intramembrane glutamic endopeptidase [Agromyces sp.]|nr:CPBP family intramembrane glutamic endopeptidase [Agromyces sp.]
MDAAAGTLLALLASLAWTWVTRTAIIDPAVQVLGAFLAVWVPLLGSVLVASRLRGRRSLARDFALRFRWIDLLWGVAIGLLARTAVSLIEIASSGRIAGFGARLELPGGFLFWFGVLLAPIVIGPFIEELFFRGLVLRAVERQTGRGIGHAASASVAVVISAMVFALLHIAQATTVSEAWRVGAGSLVLGLATGAATVLTDRLGAAIIGHMVFNGVLIAAMLTT